MPKRYMVSLQWMCSAPDCIRYVGYIVYEGKREVGRYCFDHAREQLIVDDETDSVA